LIAEVKPMGIVEFAAYVIVGKTAGKYIYVWRKEKRERIEQIAVASEHNDEKTSDYRRQRLELRYPQYFVPAPDARYFHEAAEQLKPIPLTGKERLKDWGLRLGGLTLGLIVAGIIWLVVQLIKSLF
jgi:hypothetical protein